jgi:hypothetical protein
LPIVTPGLLPLLPDVACIVAHADPGHEAPHHLRDLAVELITGL